MYKLRLFFLIMSGFSLNGCATHSLELSDSDKAAFYDKPKDKSLSSLYLTCGRNAENGEYGLWHVPDEARSCDYKINNVHYSAIFKGEVGRVDVPTGVFSLNNSNGEDDTKTLEVKEGEKLLLVTDRNRIYSPAGVAFGLIGVAVAEAIKAMNPPQKELHAPLTIYKNDFMDKISMKKPVKVFAIDTDK